MNMLANNLITPTNMEWPEILKFKLRSAVDKMKRDNGWRSDIIVIEYSKLRHVHLRKYYENNGISFNQFNYKNVIIAPKEECLSIAVIVRRNLNENISEKLDIR